MANANAKPLGGLARALAAFRGRLYTAPSNSIPGVNAQGWPSALQPIQPTAPKGSQPLAFSYFQGMNLEITPRFDSYFSAATLRKLATYPLARICIENVKDTILTKEWKIQLRRAPGEAVKDWKNRTKNDSKSKMLTEIMQAPDGQIPYMDWGRPILEDMLVIDAASCLIDRFANGKFAAARWTDGSDILRLIDDRGYTPNDPESVQFTQLWEGVPRLLLTGRQLMYRPSNIVPAPTSYSSKLYGTSITQQLAEEIAIGQQRLAFVLAYYTQGSTPGVIQVIPADAQQDKVLEALNWANSELAGNLAARRQIRPLQGFSTEGKDQIIQLKEPILADSFDDLHIRKIAFGYGVAAQRLMKQMNRASAEAGQSAAEEEGTMPRLMWWKGFLDQLIQKQMDFADYEIVFDTDKEPDPVKQSTVDKEQIANGQKSIDEWRVDNDLPPWGFPETSAPIIITTMGVQPLEGSFDRVQQQLDNDTKVAEKPAPKPVVTAGGNAGAGKAERKVPHLVIEY